MNVLPPQDAFSGLILVALLIIGLVMLIAVILLEGLVLRWLGWAPIWRSLADSAIANFASTGAGVIIGVLFQQSLTDILNSAVTPLVLLGCYVVSVGIEAGTISLIRKRPLRHVVRPFLITNAASYALILCWMLVARLAGV